MKATELEQIVQDVSSAAAQTPEFVRAQAEYVLTLVSDAEFRRLSAAIVAAHT